MGGKSNDSNIINDCRYCKIPYSDKHNCGIRIIIRGTSGAVTVNKLPDERCKVKRGDRV